MTSPLSIYLHIPFCRTKCTYCAFNTYTNLDALIPAFVDALEREIVLVGESQPRQDVHTIFFGGGTPSLLTPAQLDQLLTAINGHFSLRSDAEISMEANPNDITLEYMRGVRSVGINRLSLGMQSAIDTELRLFARRHDNDQVARAVSAARTAGFDNLNLDLIYGVPHQTVKGWDWTLQQMLALKPDHISLYALGLEEGTPMKDWVATGRLPEPDDDLAADMYEHASTLLGAAGYEQYEISNWSLPGHQCRHNLQYWRNLPYIGLGPGAHGFAGGARYAVLLSPQRYIKAMQDQNTAWIYPRTPAVEDFTLVDQDTEIAETLIMGLRLTQEGIQRDEFRRRFGIDLVELHRPIIEKYAGYGLLSVDDTAVRITTKGRLLSNVVFRDLV
jgi:oxygen-independent coproporphyrinogen III oxidase